MAFGRNDLTGEKALIAVFDPMTQQISQLPGSKGFFGPRWSPAGRYIVALAHDGNEMMLFDVQKQTWRQLDIKLSSFGYLAWSRDSAYVYFDTILSDSGYYHVRINDAKLEKLPSQFGPGSWTGLGRGDTFLFPRDISTQEIYSFDLQLP